MTLHRSVTLHTRRRNGWTPLQIAYAVAFAIFGLSIILFGW